MIEYKRLTLKTPGPFSTNNSQPYGWYDENGLCGSDLLTVLNDLGSEDWEVCAGTSSDIILKRQKVKW